MEEKFRGLDKKTNDQVDRHEVEFTNDPEIDKVVDQIVNEDSDKLIQAEDEVRERQFTPPKKTFKQRVQHVFVAWWGNKRLRNITIFGTLFFLIACMFIPYTRYPLMNLFGVRVKASMNIVDSKSGHPLKNIPVKLQNKELRTNDDGFVEFENLKQGTWSLIIDKRGYAPFEKNLTLGWGSNPIGEQNITATGAQYTFIVKDWQSKKPLTTSEASAGEDIGQSDKDGRITLTVGEQSAETEAVLRADGYREERIKLNDIDQAETEVLMASNRRHAFVSNRSGEYDLYSIDVDGKNEKVLMEATGKEREVPFVSPHTDRNLVAYISSRDGDVNKDNFILDGLFIVDTESGDSYKVTRSEQLQLVGWSGNKLIYVAVVEGVSAGNSQRSKIFSFDLDTRQRTELAASNYFNDVKLIGSTVYYAVSSYAVPTSQAKFFSIGVDGKNKQTVLDMQVWTILRKDYETLILNAVDQNWFEKVGTEQPKKLATEPASQATRVYSTSPDGKRALRVDTRDGKGVLLLYDVAGKKEEAIQTVAGLSDPVYWLDNKNIIYRVTTSQETADYILSTEGGEPKKIADVVGNRSRYFY